MPRRGLAIAAVLLSLAAHEAWLSLPIMSWTGSSLSSCFSTLVYSSRALPRACQTKVRRFAAAVDEVSVSTWTVRQLRGFLDKHGVQHADCFEKRALVDRAWALQKDLQAGKRQAPRPEAQDPAQFRGFVELVTKEAADTTCNGGEAAMIFFHGLGDSARGWASKLPDMLQLPNVRYVLPTAERFSMPVAAMGGGITSWFDQSVMGSMMGGSSMGGIMRGVGPEAMKKSLDYSHHLIRQEIARGVPAGRIFVGGFSQGGCVAVRSALSFPDAALGGVVAASTFLGDPNRLTTAESNAGISVLCCHGEADQVVPTSEGANLAARLRERGIGVQLRTYPGMGHASSAEQAADVTRFLRRRLLAQGGVEALGKLSARELKVLLRDLGVDTSACFDKGDLLEQARRNVL